MFGFGIGRAYLFFRNTGDREAAHDNFIISPISSIEEGGPFFDVAVNHQSDPFVVMRA